MYPCARPLGGNKIRLIRICPGSWSDPISCDLLYTDLDDINSYHTLSYVWGSRRITRPILVNDQTYEVTVNLESALRHLRHQLREETLVWIDALCINQSDDDERTHQVGLMGSIYRNCRSVLVYIGDGVDRFERRRNKRCRDHVPPPVVKFGKNKGDSPIRDSTDIPDTISGWPIKMEVGSPDKALSDTFRVFSLVETLSNAKHLRDLEWFQETDDPAVQEEFRTLFESLRQFSHAPFTPWWTRIWVVQEAVLPPVVTVICGTVSAPWSMFAQAAWRYLYHSRHCCYLVSMKVPRDHLNVLHSFCRLIFDLNELRETFSDTNTLYQLQLKSQHPLALVVPKEGSPDTSLLSLLRRFRNRKASDPRDKVYALLSLSLNTSVRPDYTLSERDVFIRAALDSIYASQSLSVLHVDISRKYRHDLPSWVPDWEAQGDFNDNQRLETLNLYKVHGNPVVSDRTVSSAMDWLFVDYKFVDTIDEVGSVMLSGDFESMRSTLHEWFSTASRVKSHAPSTTLEGFWRVFCADVITRPSRANGQGFVRRARSEDEFMFAKWSLLSPSSPFSFKETKGNFPAWFRDIFSREAKLWWRLSFMELFIPERNYRLLVQDLKQLIPDAETRHALIRDACIDSEERSNVNESGEMPLDVEGTIRYAMADQHDFLKMEREAYEMKLALNPDIEDDEATVRQTKRELHLQVREDRLKAWRQIPWSLVLGNIRRHLMRLYEGSIPQISIEVPGKKVAIIENSIISATKSRRLFVTSKGQFGLGPASMQPGDRLCILQGGRTPFILRRRLRHGNLFRQHEPFLPKDAATMDPRSLQIEIEGYELIGDCYAQGLMDPEAASTSDPEADVSSTSIESKWETIAIS